MMNAIVEVASATLTIGTGDDMVVSAFSKMTSFVTRIFTDATSTVASHLIFIRNSIALNGPNSLNFEGGLISAA